MAVLFGVKIGFFLKCIAPSRPHPFYSPLLVQGEGAEGKYYLFNLI
jgi:hypothetical protein